MKGCASGEETVSVFEELRAVNVATSANGSTQGPKLAVGEPELCQKAAREINRREVSTCVLAPGVDREGGVEGSNIASPDDTKWVMTSEGDPSVRNKTCSCCGHRAKTTLIQFQTF